MKYSDLLVLQKENEQVYKVSVKTILMNEIADALTRSGTRGFPVKIAINPSLMSTREENVQAIIEVLNDNGYNNVDVSCFDDTRGSVSNTRYHITIMENIR